VAFGVSVVTHSGEICQHHSRGQARLTRAVARRGGGRAVRTFWRCDLRLHLLGDWLLTAADGPSKTEEQIELPAGPQHLIALLALNGRCARTHAAATLWPDRTDEVAAARLRAVLWRLRHRHVGVPPLLEISDSWLALTGEVVVDVHTFRSSAELLIRDPELSSEEVEDAAVAVLHSSELLPGWYDDWVLAARERLQYLRLGALDALATRRRRQRRTHEALQAARAAISIEPLHESAHRTIVQTHLDNGDVVEAIKHYQRFQSMLDRELGLPPSELFRDVVSPYLAVVSRRAVRSR
jgi:DNA-binding SARP family transcriptional activator